MDEINIYLETEIHPTESEDKVREAVGNVFGNIPMRKKQSLRTVLLVADGRGQGVLEKLRNLLITDRIRDAARKAFFNGISEKTIKFCLNKQAAFMRHISFSNKTSESPLGPIRVTIESPNPIDLIDWLAPRTS
ncbi:hypothetical protein KAI12_05005 [Candidatus Bathyarchaeota archaeon]|nr:hypothetical protein [Candidatus Bathyarchaeota archaeon]